jgi:hypothetical protein
MVDLPMATAVAAICKNELKAAFRTYMDGILADIPYYVEDDFHHVNAWHRFFRLIVTPWKLVCQRRSVNLRMDIKLENPNDPIDAQLAAF